MGGDSGGGGDDSGFGGGDYGSAGGGGDNFGGYGPGGFIPDYSYTPPDLGNFDYLNGGSGGSSPPPVGGSTGGDGGGSFGSTNTGGSAFDSGSYGGQLPSWLSGANLFGTGAGNAPSSNFSGGPDSFGTGGIDSFSDSAINASSNPGQAGPLTAFQNGQGFDAGGASAFSPPTNVAAPDISTIDPTSFAATSGSTGPSVGVDSGALPQNATPTSGTGGPADLFNTAGQTPVTDASGNGTASNLNFTPDANQAGAPAGTPSTPTPSIVNSSSGSGNNQSSFGGINFKTDAGGLAGAAIAGGALLNNVINGNKVPGQDEINQIKSNIPQIQGLVDNVNATAASLRASTQPLTAEAQQMMSYVSSGKLPPTMQAQVDAGIASAKAQAASAMAARGLSADPSQNSALAAQLATIDNQGSQLSGQLANQLYQSGLAAWQTGNQTQSVAASLENTGLQAVGLTQNTYLALQKIYADQDKQQQTAIANFAGALGKLSGGGSGTTIKIGGS